MSALSSSSTDTQVRAAYDDNSGYEFNRSSSECRAFINACIILLRRDPASTSNGVTSLSLSPDQIRKEIDYARTWLMRNSTNTTDRGGPRFTRSSFETLR